MHSESIRFENYVFRPLEERDVIATRDLLSSSFTEMEPVTIAMDIQKTEHLPFSLEIVLGALSDGLSFVAEEIDSKQIVGFSICEDSLKLHPSNQPFSSKYSPIVALLDNFKEAKAKLQNKNGRTIHVFMIGVDANYANQGLATKLVSHSIESAQRAGFASAVAEVTAAYSQKLFSTLGFQVENEISYDTFEFDGGYPFRRISEPKTCKLVQKTLKD